VRIRLTLDITRRRDPQPEQSDGPNIYDLSGAYIERDPSLDMEADPETRFRIGFNAKDDQ